MDNTERPMPGLGPAPITMEQYEALTPEKLELWQGYLIARRTGTKDEGICCCSCS
jgi:hypothetical protein